MSDFFNPSPQYKASKRGTKYPNPWDTIGVFDSKEEALSAIQAHEEEPLMLAGNGWQVHAVGKDRQWGGVYGIILKVETDDLPFPLTGDGR